jgi:adenosylcobinamide-phosphate synthase
VVSVRLATVSTGIAADWLLGEPPPSWHPVAGFGRAMTWLEGRCYSDSRGRGALFAAVGTGAAAGAGWLLAAGRPPSSCPGWSRAGRPGAGRSRTGRGQAAAALVTATYVAVAGRALAQTARQVAEPLAAGDLHTARARLPSLVGRDPAGLDQAEVARAVVESVAENTVDAVIAPALWAALAGAPGVLAYRAVNTLDAMVGHRSPRYARFGWAAARADDVAAWVPARITAVLVAAVRPAAAARVWGAVRGQAGAHPSPNAGVAEAAFAAALGVRLGGVNSYQGRQERRPDLGSGPPPGAADIGRAIRLSRDVTAALVGLGAAASVALVPAAARGRS